MTDLVYCRECGVRFPRAGKRCLCGGCAPPYRRPLTAAALSVRNAEIGSLYRSGLLLKDIGQRYGITRERVRQICARQGMNAIDGGQKVQVRRKRAERQRERDARQMRINGMTAAERRAIPSKYRLGFTYQRNNMRRLGIGWELSFAQWWEIWQASGHLDERGNARTGGKYWLVRIDTSGPFSEDNVAVMIGSRRRPAFAEAAE